MSAFMVSKSHIDYILHAALAINARDRFGSARFNGEIVDLMNADAVGRALWFTNVASVTHRYPNVDFDSGEWGIDRESILTYSCPVFPAKPFDIVATLKALDCYEYQSCEHEGWRQSEAFAFVDRMRGALIGMLPGYDNAPWEIDADTIVPVVAAITR